MKTTHFSNVNAHTAFAVKALNIVMQLMTCYMLCSFQYLVTNGL